MPAQLISPDATIASIVHTLNDPIRYVWNVHRWMWSCKKRCGNPSVRIGLTGEGKAPHYKIEYSNDRGQHLFGVYRGLGHRPFEGLGEVGINDVIISDDPREKIAAHAEIANRDAPEHPDHLLEDRNWSSCVMSLEEVGLLRVELEKRGRGKRHA